MYEDKKCGSRSTAALYTSMSCSVLAVHGLLSAANQLRVIKCMVFLNQLVATQTTPVT